MSILISWMLPSREGRRDVRLSLDCIEKYLGDEESTALGVFVRAFPEDQARQKDLSCLWESP